jgi:RimJ/RimL family protein N-acetyltransferase
MIRTRRLLIDPRAVEHAAALCDALGDESVGRYIGGPEVTTVEAMAEQIEYVLTAPAHERGQRWLNWVVRIADVADTPLIGRVEATVHIDRTPLAAEFAYVFGPRWSGHGYATEATSWMLDELRDAHAVAVAYATVHPDNAASVRLLDRLDFVIVTDPLPTLASYDDGDLVFVKELA